MKISHNMNLDQLAERMGGDATEASAYVMRDLLVEKYDGQDTSDVPSVEWFEMLDQAA